MDKKTKKKIEVLRKRIDKLHLLVKGAKEQMDDPDEVVKLESNLAEAKAEMARLKTK